MEGHSVKQERLLLRPLEVAAQLGITRSLVYQLIASGQLNAVTVGKSVRIPTRAVHQFVAARPGRRPRRMASLQRTKRAVTRQGRRPAEPVVSFHAVDARPTRSVKRRSAGGNSGCVHEAVPTTGKHTRRDTE